MSTQLTLGEAAKKLNVSEKSIRRYIKAGRMRANLIKGQKGYEYRIDANQLKILNKPPRGKNSHKDKKVILRPIRQAQGRQAQDLRKNKRIIKKSPVETRHSVSKKVVKKNKVARPLESIGEILKKKIETRTVPTIQNKIPDINLVDYKTLYENLLVKYEQTLLMLGALEAQVLNRANPINNAKIEKMEDSMAKQEEIIMDLYQTIQLYKNENNY